MALYKWVTGLVIPISGVITLLTTGRGPPCSCYHRLAGDHLAITALMCCPSHLLRRARSHNEVIVNNWWKRAQRFGCKFSRLRFVPVPNEPGSKLVVLGMAIPPLIGNPCSGYINPYYWVDDHPLLYGNNGSLDPSTNQKSPIGYVGVFHLGIHKT